MSIPLYTILYKKGCYVHEMLSEHDRDFYVKVL